MKTLLLTVAALCSCTNRDVGPELADPGGYVQHHVIATAAAGHAVTGEATFDRIRWQIPATGAVYFPVPVESGCTLRGYAAHIFRTNISVEVGVSLIVVSPSTRTSMSAAGPIGPGPAQSGSMVLRSPQLSHYASNDEPSYIEVLMDSVGVAPAPEVYAAEFSYTCPVQASGPLDG